MKETSIKFLFTASVEQFCLDSFVEELIYESKVFTCHSNFRILDGLAEAHSLKKIIINLDIKELYELECISSLKGRF